MRGFFLVAVTAVILVGTSIFAHAEKMKLVVANEGDYPPFSITRADGTITGVDVELVRELCKRIDAECDIQVMDFKAQLPSLVTGKIDLIGNGLYPKPKRLEKTEFLDPHVKVQEGWLLPSSWSKGVASGTMNGVKVGSISGAAWNDFIKKAHPGVELVTYDNLQEIVLDLEAGRIVATYGPQLGIATNIEKRNLTDKFKFTPLVFEGRNTAGNSFAVQKGNVKLRDKLNAALETIFQDCTYSKMRLKFVAIPLSTREPKNCL